MSDLMTELDKQIQNAAANVAAMTDSVRAGFDTLVHATALTLAKANERRLNKIDEDLVQIRAQQASIVNSHKELKADLAELNNFCIEQKKRIDTAAVKIQALEKEKA